jgi:hypothetical protein
MSEAGARIPALLRGGRRRSRALVQKLDWAWRLRTAAARALPDFIIIGAQKCGTSSMYRYLCHHPWIVPARVKEVHFFDTESFSNGINWYRAYFPLRARMTLAKRGGRRPITGEASPYYLYYPHAPRRIAQVLPGVKLIVMLRNPVDRAFSHYYHQVRKGREALSFEEAIGAEAQRLNGERERSHQDPAYYSYSDWAYSYLARGIYVDQLKGWLEAFPRQQFLFLKSEDFFANPADGFEQVLRFLGMPVIDLARYESHNVGSYQSKMPSHLRQKLESYFESHNERLRDLLGTDLGWQAERAGVSASSASGAAEIRRG